MRDNLDRLPAAPRVTDKMVICERFYYLDAVCRMARERGIKTSELAIAGTIVPEQMAFWNSIDEAAAAGVLDWDLILRLGNSRFDRIVETIQEPAQARRRAAQARLDLEIRKQNDESRDKLKLGIRMFFNRRDAVSESIGHSLYALFTTGLRLAAYSQDDSLVRLDLTRLGFALAAYRAGPRGLSGEVGRLGAEAHGQDTARPLQRWRPSLLPARRRLSSLQRRPQRPGRWRKTNERPLRRRGSSRRRYFDPHAGDEVAARAARPAAPAKPLAKCTRGRI